MLAMAILISVAAIAASRNASQSVRNQSSERIMGTGDKRVSARENFHGAEVVANEVLIEFERCDDQDSQTFLTKVTRLAKQLTSDDASGDEPVVSQVVNDCWFSVKSAKLSANKLLGLFLSRKNLKLTLADNQQLPPIVDVEPNFVIKLEPNLEGNGIESCPDDDLFKQGKLWGLRNPDNLGIDVDAVRAWTLTKGSRDIVVGVIDTGLYYEHPDLKDNVWCAPEAFEVKIGNDVIPCGAGSHGYNALAETLDKRCDPLDGIQTSGNGTHVSGTIGAVGNNHKGVVGVNWYTKLIGLKFIGPAGGEVVDAAKAIEFAIQVREHFGAKANIRVLNASWGYRDEDNVSQADSNLLRDTIERAGENGILFVASAGQNKSNNDDKPHYPSSFDLPNLVSVTAIDKEGFLASFSGTLANVGKKSVLLAAPGRGIYSTYSINQHYCYYVDSGTSMAAPFVSGAAALVLSYPPCASLSARKLKRAIRRGVKTTRAPTLTATGGMLNVYQSMKQCR